MSEHEQRVADLSEPVNPIDKERFLSKINKLGPVPAHRPELGPCWLWTGWKFVSTGYGGFNLANKKKVSAHRMAWMVFNGDIPILLRVLHKCDNKPCVRPDHLWLGSNADNSADMVEKGRQAKGERFENRRILRGDEIGNSKLSPESVSEIRTRRAAGETLVVLALHYNVDIGTISKIALRRIWSHIA
jgi:hypothetical protein